MEGIQAEAKRARRILREAEVKHKTGLSRATRWRWAQAGLFPQKVRLGPNSAGNFEDEVDDWLQARAAEREAVA